MPTMLPAGDAVIDRWLYRLFNALLLAALPLVALWVLFRWRRRVFSKGFYRWSERWGHLSEETRASLSRQGRWWWVHAVSVGEVKAIAPFLRRVSKEGDVRVFLTAVTPEAMTWATEQKLAPVIAAAPIDLPWVVRRVFRAVRPELFITVESEFWPNLLRQAKKAGASVALINGRLSERSFRSFHAFRFLLNPMWKNIDLLAVRQDQDAGRFRALGLSPGKIHVTGNLKYDLLTPRASSNGSSRLSKGTGPVIVMGSTREGEEAQLLPVLEQIRAEFPTVTFIWAPRHIERVPEVEALLQSQGLIFQRKSDCVGSSDKSEESPSHLLWDSTGDLLDAYRQADIAIVGGSFVPKGGQNPIEPAALERPVLFGPWMDNFKGVSDHLVREGGASQVSLDHLGSQLRMLLNDPVARKQMGERARHAVEAEQGATERTLKLLKALRHG